jgi:methyltransferase (TIGR00027 family)
MKATVASQTARFMALFRALESRLPAGQRRCYDPLARRYLSGWLRVVVSLSGLQPVNRLLCAAIDRRWPGARNSGVARTRWIDEAALAALQRGAGQLVLLGAGFDSRAYRLALGSAVVAYEVDHPATSVEKEKLTQAALGSIPERVVFVRMDFNREDLGEVLQRAGYRPGVQSIFVWEGVSNYLTEEAVQSTLSFCGRAAPNSSLVFTYVDKRVIEEPASFYGTQRIVKLLSGVGERWTYGMDPRRVRSQLERHGLILERDVGAGEYRRECYGPAGDRMRGYEFYRVAVATVQARTTPTPDR